MELESQVAKIQLGPENGSFVFLFAEKLPLGQNESFIVAEVMETDQSLSTSTEQIALSIRSSVRRAFKKSGGPETFESAVAQVNEELGKLASLGQTHWIEKLNCIIGAKTGDIFSIATTGKVASFLMRDGEFTDLNCSALKPHPLKTFENFASGKLRLGDILILSTSQLFNHISIDKLKQMLSQDDFLKTSGQIVELLKANSPAGVAFGSIFARQVEKGTLPETEIDLEEYVEALSPLKPSIATRLKTFARALLFPGKPDSIPGYGGKSVLKNQFKGAGAKAGKITAGAKNLLGALISRARILGKANLTPSQIKQFSPAKKFFFFSVAALLLALVLQITAAVYFKNKKQAENRILANIESAKKDLSDADAALLYKDEPAAKDFYLKSLSTLNNLGKLSKEQEAIASEVKNQSREIRDRLEKTLQAESTNLGTLAAGTNLIRLPEYLAVQSAGRLVSFYKPTNAIRDDVLKYEGAIRLAEAIGKDRAVIYSGENLTIWNYTQSTAGQSLAGGVPSEQNAIGLKLYSVNQRVYMLDKSKNQILNFAVLGDQLGRSQISTNLKNDDGKNAVDFAIDGSIYVLTGETVKKYHQGSPAEFAFGALTPLSNPKKIQTQTGYSNIYVLDSGNKRILVLNKNGSIIMSLTNPDFTDMIDFEVDEKNKTIYILNGTSLLKISIP